MDGVVPSIAECHFLDVGQASCTIFLLGKRRGLVFDLPMTKHLPFRFLRDHVDFLDVLAITHNDADHAKGLMEAYGHYRANTACSIGTVCLLVDRPPKVGTWRDFLGLLKSDLREGKVECVLRLETRRDQPHQVWERPEADLALDVLYPDFLANATASAPNETSAILRLRAGRCSVLITGDAPYWALEQASQILGGPLKCDIMTVPHHGGLYACDSPSLDSIFRQTVVSSFGIVSVCTTNKYGHPSSDVVHALTRAGVSVLCTQITPQCCDNPCSLSPGLRAPGPYCRSGLETAPRWRGSRGPNVACAGTVIALLANNGIVVEGLDQHRKAVGRLAALAEGHPLCA
jgi:beta-lactamase superfamily II metal-dependent hydrolase